MSYWIQSPQLQFDEEEHRYTWDGVRKRSVTQVLSDVATRKTLPDGTATWVPVGFDDRWTRDDAASQFGTAFHKVCAIILRGGSPEYPESMEPWVQQFKRFLREWQIHPLWDVLHGTPIVEYPMYSSVLDVAGTADLLAVYGPKRQIAVFDWKSSTSFQQHWRAQTAAYAKMAKEVLGIREKVHHIPVRFDEEMYYPDVRENNPEDFIWFQSLNNVLKAA